jgi:peptidoglycan/LPS O-acetylase OafA/YrhL
MSRQNRVPLRTVLLFAVLCLIAFFSVPVMTRYWAVSVDAADSVRGALLGVSIGLLAVFTIARRRGRLAARQDNRPPGRPERTRRIAAMWLLGGAACLAAGIMADRLQPALFAVATLAFAGSVVNLRRPTSAPEVSRGQLTDR